MKIRGKCVAECHGHLQRYSVEIIYEMMNLEKSSGDLTCSEWFSIRNDVASKFGWVNTFGEDTVVSWEFAKQRDTIGILPDEIMVCARAMVNDDIIHRNYVFTKKKIMEIIP
tara:strand:- start:171 stop:506 length:336 start_codon:yes stop_codon:yes gene_type:complete